MTSRILGTCGIAVLLSSSPLLAAEPVQSVEYVYNCKADREAIATAEFLKSHKEFGLTLGQMRLISLKVSEGCTGSADAFVSIVELLLKSRMDGKSAINQAQTLAAAGPAKAKAFESIFKRAFASEVFDLDLKTALSLALRLSSELKGNPEIVATDFQKLSEFCTSQAGLGLSRPQCAAVVQRVLLANAESGEPIADGFTSFFKFLTDSGKVQLTAGDALKIAEMLADRSREAFSVFKNSYDYAQSESGLGLDRAEAIKFATEIARNVKQPRDKLGRMAGSTVAGGYSSNIR